VVDALGKPPSGIFEGNLKWGGAYDECKRITSKIGSPFDGKYCHFKLLLKLPGALVSILFSSILKVQVHSI